MKHLLLLSCIVLCSLFSFSQKKNFSPGYVIKNSGDSVHGFLQEEIRENLSAHVQFATDMNSAATAFTTADIKAFGYDGGSTYKKMAFTAVFMDTTVEKICFARQLLGGTYGLFSYMEDEAKYFLINKGDSVYFIYNTTYTALGTIRESGNFLEILKLVSASCEQLNSHFDRFAYTEKDMLRFVIQLNQCMAPNASTTSYYHKLKSITNIFVFAGGFTTGKESQFTADMSLRLTYPQISKKASLNVGVHYSNTLTSETLLNGGNIKYVADTRHEIFSIPITLQYNFTSGIIQPFVYFGASGLMHRETKEKTAYTAMTQDSQYGLGLVAAAGVEGHITKKFFINAEWHFEEPIQNFSLFQYPAIGLAYKF